MANQKNNFSDQIKLFTTLAFEQAKINLGSTKKNPSVGCVIEKNGSVISVGNTSINGRPHAEFNALKKKIDFKDSNLFVTLEPCSHYGKTPPCTNLIKEKGIKKVFFSTYDFDSRSRKKSKTILKKSKIKVEDNVCNIYASKFYKSYLYQHSQHLPLIDAKIAISKDYYTKNRKQKWITNNRSRKSAQFIRTMYDCIVSTSKSINDDNSRLNCRIEGLENKSPLIVIIDRKLRLKKNLKIFKNTNRGIIFTEIKKKSKISFFKRRGFKTIVFKSLKEKNDFNKLFLILKKNFSRIYVESGLTFLNFLIKNRYINNLYVFRTNQNLKRNGYNNASNYFLKKVKLRNMIKVNLGDDKLYKVNLNNV